MHGARGAMTLLNLKILHRNLIFEVAPVCYVSWLAQRVLWFKDRYVHGMAVISKNTAHQSVMVSVLVSVDKFSFVFGIKSIGKKSGIGPPLFHTI